MQHSNVYLQRYAYPEEYLKKETVPDNLGMVVVIPAYNERNILPALKSLDECKLPERNVEVIVVVNQPVDCSPKVDNINQQTIQQVIFFNKQKSNSRINYQAIHARDLPIKNSGVGMARKIGMDEAVRRLLRSGNNHGVIINFDADCTCSNSYLQNIEKSFNENNINGASIYFEHPLHTLEHQKLIEGIIQYELHLRYFVHALRYAGFPYAFHTVGSSMAVRSDIYQQQGGMNKRKAGEDFYFLQKIFPLGNYMEIIDTVVMPSVRVSDRVPFGTGRAMTEWANRQNHNLLTYSPEIFKDMKMVFTDVDLYFTLSNSAIKQHYTAMPLSFRNFITENEFLNKISICQSKSARSETFRQKFFTWMNGLKVLKYIHHSRDNHYPNIPVFESGSWAIKEIFKVDDILNSAEEVLLFFRKHDRENPVKSDQKGRIFPNSVRQ